MKKLHTFLIVSILLRATGAHALEGIFSYEKYLRLNRPVYRSDSGNWLNLSFKSSPVEDEKTVIKHYYEGDLRLYFEDNNDLAYSVQEAYLDYKHEGYQFYLGRKILDWNQNEAFWGLGYLNASQGFSLLGDGEEGVTGLFVKKQFGDFEVEALASYLFIPALNPSIEIKNGSVRAKNDWVRLPPTRTLYNARVIPIRYETGKINYSKILFNKSMGANVRYLYSKGWFSAFALYKPENHLRINASAAYVPDIDKVVVTANPTINHHAYYGLLWQHFFGNTRALGGVSYVDPNAKLGKDINLLSIENGRREFSSEYFKIKPNYDREAYGHFSLNFDRGKYGLSANYIQILTKNKRGSDDFYSDTVRWKRAVGFKVDYFFTDSLSGLANWKYDLARKDNILKMEVKFDYNKRFMWLAGVELLKAPETSSFWSYYRSNDVLYTEIGLYY